mmetsp:Transcript_25047/g.49891  ORF Transcript_25047/g.49891 Transcript_25047/m.49891 type:complete len:287 (+) Transcript_25047:68-928(+)
MPLSAFLAAQLGCALPFSFHSLPIPPTAALSTIFVPASFATARPLSSTSDAGFFASRQFTLESHFSPLFLASTAFALAFLALCPFLFFLWLVTAAHSSSSSPPGPYGLLCEGPPVASPSASASPFKVRNTPDSAVYAAAASAPASPPFSFFFFFDGGLRLRLRLAAKSCSTRSLSRIRLRRPPAGHARGRPRSSDVPKQRGAAPRGLAASFGQGPRATVAFAFAAAAARGDTKEEHSGVVRFVLSRSRRRLRLRTLSHLRRRRRRLRTSLRRRSRRRRRRRRRGRG